MAKSRKESTQAPTNEPRRYLAVIEQRGNELLKLYDTLKQDDEDYEGLRRRWGKGLGDRRRGTSKTFPLTSGLKCSPQACTGPWSLDQPADQAA